VTQPPASVEAAQARSGGLVMFAAYVMWGCFPLYFHLFTGVSAWEVLAHRVVWSVAFVSILISLMGRWGAVALVLGSIRRLWMFLLSGFFISINWGVFIWASTNGHIIDAGMGYFLNPLVAVALGALWLKERMSRRQLAALLLVGAGVAVLVIKQGQVPWIALALALAFGHYGLVRKQAPADPLTGLLAETLMVTPLALGFIVYQYTSGQGAFLVGNPKMDALLAISGVVSSVPLILFAFGAKRIRLATVGLLQYVNPTMHVLLAVFLFGEAFNAAYGLAFAGIWTGLALYSWDTLRRLRR